MATMMTIQITLFVSYDGDERICHTMRDLVHGNPQRLGWITGHD